MLHYSETGKTKSGEINISKACMALLFSTDQPFSEIVNEKITVYIERAKGSNTEIATNVPIAEILPVSMHGISAIMQKSGTTKGLIFLGDGAVRLGENETIKVVLDGLKSAKTYTINSVESPLTVDDVKRYERKTVTSDETVRDFDVSGFTLAQIGGFDKLTELFITYANGVTVKMLPAELLAIAEFADPTAVFVDGTAVSSPANAVLVELIDVVSIQVQKNTGGAVNICLLR